MITVSEFRTRNIHENFCPIFNDIQVGEKVVIRCNDYLSSDNQSAFYETNFSQIAARVYYDKKSLTKPEMQARNTIFSVCTDEIPYMYYSDSDCSLDIIPQTSALKSQYTYDQLKQTVIPQINNLLKRLSSYGILHRSLTNRSFGIFTQNEQDKIVLIDFSSVIQIPDKRIKLEDKQAKGSGVFCSYESLRGTYYLEKSDYYSFGIIIASLYLGKIPKDIDELKDLISKAPHDLGLLIKLLTELDHTNRGNSATVDDWLSMPVKHFIEKYKCVIDQVEFTFLGETYTSRYELASALANNWSEGIIHLRTNALIDFLNRQADQDLAAKIISSIQNDDSDDLKFAKCLYLFDGTGRFFWKRAFNSANDLLKSEYLRDIILSDYLIWILEQDKESSQKIKTQRQLKEITMLNTNLGLALAKFIFSSDETEYPMPHEFFSERFDGKSIKISDITDDVLAYLIFNGEFENLKEYINTRTAYQESQIINFYRCFEHSVQEESYKETIRTHFIKYGPYSEDIKIRHHARKFQYYNGDSPSLIHKMGIDHLPTPDDSINSIKENCLKYYSAVREFEKNAECDRFTLCYGLFNINNPNIIVPKNYGAAFRREDNETLKRKLTEKANSIRSFTAHINTKFTIICSILALILTGYFIYIICSLPSENFLDKSVIVLSSLLLFITAIGIPKNLINGFRLNKIKISALDMANEIENEYIPNIASIYDDLLSKPENEKIDYSKSIEKRKIEFESTAYKLKKDKICSKIYVIIWTALSVITVFIFGLANNFKFMHKNINLICKIFPSLENGFLLSSLKVFFCILVFISFIILIGVIIYLIYDYIIEVEEEVEKCFLTFGLGLIIVAVNITGMVMPIILGIVLILSIPLYLLSSS